MRRTYRDKKITGYPSAVGYSGALILQAVIALGVAWFVTTRPSTTFSPQSVFVLAKVLIPAVLVAISGIFIVAYFEEQDESPTTEERLDRIEGKVDELAEDIGVDDSTEPTTTQRSDWVDYFISDEFRQWVDDSSTSQLVKYNAVFFGLLLFYTAGWLWLLISGEVSAWEFLPPAGVLSMLTAIIYKFATEPWASFGGMALAYTPVLIIVCTLLTVGVL